MEANFMPGPLSMGLRYNASSPSSSSVYTSSSSSNSPVEYSMSKQSLPSNDSNQRRAKKQSNMRVAIAGTGGIAWWIAHFIHEETGHHLLWLSRSAKPHLTNHGFQVMVVDYNDRRSLEYALRGVDVVISTIPGTLQIRIVDAAIKAGVKRFAPAEFEGRPSRRAEDNAVNRFLDRGKSQVLAHLHQRRAQIESTVFVCGVLYERFSPGGLQHHRMGGSTGVAQEGNFMIDVRHLQAQLPYKNAAGQQVSLCLTAAQDVGRFITRSLDIQQRWPPEMIMHGERVTSYELLRIVARARGRTFESQNLVYHDPTSLRNLLRSFPANDTGSEARQIRELVATQDGRYEYSQSNLNAAFQDVRPLSFEDWLRRNWSS